MAQPANRFWQISLRGLLFLMVIWGPLFALWGSIWRANGWSWEVPVAFLAGSLVFVVPLLLYVAVRLVIHRLLTRWSLGNRRE